MNVSVTFTDSVKLMRLGSAGGCWRKGEVVMAGSRASSTVMMTEVCRVRCETPLPRLSRQHEGRMSRSDP